MGNLHKALKMSQCLNCRNELNSLRFRISVHLAEFFSRISSAQISEIRLVGNFEHIVQT